MRKKKPISRIWQKVRVIYSLVKRRWRILLIFLLSVLLLISIYHIEVRGGTGAYQFEKPWDAIRRATITSTTIGYGDIIPTTFWGQFLSLFYIICTLLLLSEGVSYLSRAIYTAQLNAMKGLTPTTYDNHTIIYGGLHQQMTTMIEQLFEEHTSMSFVVMSPIDTIPSSILALKQSGIPIHFVTGTPAETDSLNRAHIEKAATCILLHEPRSDSDMYILSYVMNIRTLSPSVKIIVEMLKESHRNIFEKAGCDSIINTDTITKNLLVRSVTDDVHHIMRELLTFGDGYELYRVALKERRHEKTFGQLITAYLDDPMHVVGLYQNGHVFFDSSHVLTPDTRVYIISQERYQAI